MDDRLILTVPRRSVRYIYGTIVYFLMSSLFLNKPLKDADFHKLFKFPCKSPKLKE